MRSKAGRSVYAVLLRLHPDGFRRSFGDEMLRVFDEASESYGTAWLLGDVGVSLARQWLFRSTEESELSPEAAQFGLLAGSYPDFKPPHLTVSKLSAALILTVASFLVFPSNVGHPHHAATGRASLRVEVRNAWPLRG